MILYNSWLMVQQGWDHLWHQSDWILLKVVTAMGLPMPLVGACLIACAYFFGSIFLIVGVFGRIPTAFLLLITEVGCYFAVMGGATAYVELSVLYGTLYALHLILGSGRLSLDQVLMGAGRRRFRKRNPVEF